MLGLITGPQDLESLNIRADLSDMQPKFAVQLSQWPLELVQRRGGPSFIEERARMGKNTPTYTYARSNPVMNIDPNGLYDVPYNPPPGPFQNNPPPGWKGPRPPPQQPQPPKDPQACDDLTRCFIACEEFSVGCNEVCKGFSGNKRSICEGVCAVATGACYIKCVADNLPN